MTADLQAPTTADTQETFDSLSPVTGDVVGTWPVHSSEDVTAAVERAREGAEWWSALTFDERAQRLKAWAGVMTRRIAQLANVMNQETGKPHSDATLEVALALDHVCLLYTSDAADD